MTGQRVEDAYNKSAKNICEITLGSQLVDGLQKTPLLLRRYRIFTQGTLILYINDACTLCFEFQLETLSRVKTGINTMSHREILVRFFPRIYIFLLFFFLL
jgi:hypothetical protein